MNNMPIDMKAWHKARIKIEEVHKYMTGDVDFIAKEDIPGILKRCERVDSRRIRDILNKSLAVQSLSLEETAALLSVKDENLLSEMRDAAFQVKKKVYDNRIVTFAPLYLGSYCVNNCAYCGFKMENKHELRNVLTPSEIRQEVEALAGTIGHKRLIVVYGEHPKNDVDYIVSSIKEIYNVKVKVNGHDASIRRVNVNAPPFCIDDLKKIKEAGIGTYQVFQETYNLSAYQNVHPAATIKGDYYWRLYAMHRALEAGIDDVGIGALFGLYNWKFEVMGLIAHALELEKCFGVGPHTISFPRLEPALNFDRDPFEQYRVSDDDFKKAILVLRLAAPYAGMIITARENAQMRREAVALGITQTDASSHIALGGYHSARVEQDQRVQQFILGDTRSLDEVIQEFVRMGHITSFCTAGYRCGRTGECIMDLLRSGQEGKFCKLNAILTFKEWIDDFASEETKVLAQPLLEKEIAEVRQTNPQVFDLFMGYYKRIESGERDLYL
jgi:2-iminoacetate synthase